MEWYIDTARYSDGSYYVDGQEMPYCTKSGSKHDLHSVASSYENAFGPLRCYITYSVLATLDAAGVLETLRPQILGIVPNDYAQRYNVGGDFPYCWDLKEGVVPEPLPYPDPCRDVVCADKCYGVDKYSTVCDEGECLPGTLLEPNSVECGYVPSVCNEGELRGAITCADGSTVYTEICHNNAWVPTGDKCPEDIVPTTDVLKYLLIGVAIIAVYLFVKGR